MAPLFLQNDSESVTEMNKIMDIWKLFLYNIMLYFSWELWYKLNYLIKIIVRNLKKENVVLQLLYIKLHTSWLAENE